MIILLADEKLLSLREKEGNMTVPEKPSTLGEKSDSSLLDFILRNPKFTSLFLFVLAVVPLVALALIVGLVWLGH